jgi:type II secretory pathway component GspD/PulD (secretin)
MSSALRMLAVRTFIAVVPLATLPVGHAQSFELKWPPGPYKYIVVDQDARDTLLEMGRQLNIPIKLSDQIKGRVQGPLPAATAEEFLKRVCESQGLVWYFDGSVLHISTEAELKTELIDLGQLPAKDLTHRLGQLGIADARYPLRTTGDVRIISVSGPPAYVALVRQTATAMMVSAEAPVPAREVGGGDERKVRVFRGGSLELSAPGTVRTDEDERSDRFGEGNAMSTVNGVSGTTNQAASTITPEELAAAEQVAMQQVATTIVMQGQQALQDLTQQAKEEEDEQDAGG